mmetsp:Transcript_41430/g.69083  ORF Transcript_41430/g.69083 Transcript_41430/m.69083 type:complete len:97 (-) Transcript_41430:102-392(-)
MQQKRLYSVKRSSSLAAQTPNPPHPAKVSSGYSPSSGPQSSLSDSFLDVTQHKERNAVRETYTPHCLVSTGTQAFSSGQSFPWDFTFIWAAVLFVR